MQIQDETQQENEQFEMLLTQYFYQKVNQFLPEGYSLQPAKKKTNKKKENTTNLLKKKNDLKQEHTKKKEKPYSNFDTSKYERIIMLLKVHPKSEPFLNPVDPKKQGIPNYFDIIKEPMDLSTVHKNLKNNKYQNEEQIIQDINKIWNNALKFNPQDSQIYNMATQMQTKSITLYKMSKKEIMQQSEGNEFSFQNKKFDEDQQNDSKEQLLKLQNKSNQIIRDFENFDKKRSQQNQDQQQQQNQNFTQSQTSIKKKTQDTKRLNKESSVSKSSYISNLDSNENQFINSYIKSIINALDFYSSTVGLK